MQKQEIQKILEDDPGNPVFAELAELLRKEGDLTSAMDVCLAGMSRNEDFHKGRLVLARIFYQKGYLPFAVRELEQLCAAFPASKRLKRLLEVISPYEMSRQSPASEKAGDAGADPAGDETLAEADFDLDILEDEQD